MGLRLADRLVSPSANTKRCTSVWSVSIHLAMVAPQPITSSSGCAATTRTVLNMAGCVPTFNALHIVYGPMDENALTTAADPLPRPTDKLRDCEPSRIHFACSVETSRVSTFQEEPTAHGDIPNNALHKDQWSFPQDLIIDYRSPKPAHEHGGIFIHRIFALV